MINKKHVDIKNARPGAYGEVLKKIQGHGVCPFCTKHLSTYHSNPILEEKNHWLVTNSAFPYKPTKEHILLIHRVHIEHLMDLSIEAWQELREIIAEQVKKRNITGGTFLLRFGDTAFTGGSVTHLHAHIIQSDPTDPTYQTKKEVAGLAVRIG